MPTLIPTTCGYITLHVYISFGYDSADNFKKEKFYFLGYPSGYNVRFLLWERGPYLHRGIPSNTMALNQEKLVASRVGEDSRVFLGLVS